MRKLTKVVLCRQVGNHLKQQFANLKKSFHFQVRTFPIGWSQEEKKLILRIPGKINVF